MQNCGEFSDKNTQAIWRNHTS